MLQMPEAPDPIHYREGNWYFYDETWSFEYGPYKSREEASIALTKYVERL